jgi:uncharacterized lipoprotein
MYRARTIRRLLFPALLPGLFAGCSRDTHAQRHTPVVQFSRSSPQLEKTSYPGGAVQQQTPAPIERRAPSAAQVPNRPQRTPSVGPVPGNLSGHRGEHLPEWMNQHRGLSLQQQQHALEHEPGFRELPAPTQERMRERLSQLSAMSPQERDRIVDRTEAMERLSPEQRTQVRGAMQQLGALPPDQRQIVARSFRELRQLPAGQRSAAMNSERYRWMNEEQRSALTNLIQVAPMLPPSQH